MCPVLFFGYCPGTPERNWNSWLLKFLYLGLIYRKPGIISDTLYKRQVAKSWDIRPFYLRRSF
jgi:hypothetical protein